MCAQWLWGQRARRPGTVTDPLDNYVVYTFSAAQPWQTPAIPALETLRQYYDASGHLLKSVAKACNAPNSNSVPILPLSETTTLDNGMVAQVQWTYDLRTIGEYNSPLLEKREYDYGQGAPGPLLRKTDYDWLELDDWADYGYPNANATQGSHICCYG